MLLYLLADGEEFACQIMMLGTMNYLITPLDEGKVQYKAVQFFHTCENKAGLQGKKQCPLKLSSSWQQEADTSDSFNTPLQITSRPYLPFSNI